MNTSPVRSSARAIETFAPKIRPLQSSTRHPEAEWRFFRRLKLQVLWSAPHNSQRLAAATMDPISSIRRRLALGRTAWIASMSSKSVTCAAASALVKLNCRSARPQHSRGRRQLRDLPPLVNWKSHLLLKDRPQRKTTRSRGQWAQKITIPQVSVATKIWCTAAVPWSVWPPRKIARSRSLRTSSLSTLLKRWRDVGSKKSRTCFRQ